MSGTSERRITDLPTLIEALEPEDRAAAGRLFDVVATTGRLDPPEAMRAWIERSFGSVEAVTEQRVIKVTNRVTLEGSLFNGLRASRPLDTSVSVDLEREIEATVGDPFCRPEEGTPADVFGRGEGRVLRDRLERRQIRRLPRRRRLRRPQPPPPQPREGLRLHFRGPRVVPQGSPDRPRGKVPLPHVELPLARRRLDHPRPRPGNSYPRRPLPEDRAPPAGRSVLQSQTWLRLLRRPVPCPRRSGAGHSRRRGRQSLREPCSYQGEGASRDRPEPGGRGPSTNGRGSAQSYLQTLGVRAFNVAFYMPPLTPSEEGWSGFPTVVHMVDRGSSANRTSDIGAMELYAASVVASDPFRVADLLRNGPLEDT